MGVSQLLATSLQISLFSSFQLRRRMRTILRWLFWSCCGGATSLPPISMLTIPIDPYRVVFHCVPIYCTRLYFVVTALWISPHVVCFGLAARSAEPRQIKERKWLERRVQNGFRFWVSGRPSDLVNMPSTLQIGVFLSLNHFSVGSSGRISCRKSKPLIWQFRDL